MKKIKSVLFWVIMILISCIALFFGYKYYYKNYYIPSHTDIISKFTIADLKYETLYYKCSKYTAISVLGDPISSSSTTDENTSNYMETLVYDGYILSFSNDELIRFSSTSKDFSFKNIKIGDSKDKVLNSFYKEENTAYAYSADEQIIGTYIYGNFNINNLETVKTKDAIFYAYQTNKYIDGNFSSNDSNDYYLIYVYMCPPYKGEYASSNDSCSTLTFGVKNDLITSISWEVSEN